MEERTRTKTLKVGSLFSGIGGIELGFDNQGYTTQWFIDYEPYAQAVLRKHWHNTKIYDDITKIDFKELSEVDVLTGGFPCQDISNAGKRAGIKGNRSSLWKYYLEAIRVLRPKYAVIENVSALLRRGLNVVLSDLASVGYDAEWYCIPAAAVGAPHRRDRIFILAYPHGRQELCSEYDRFSIKKKFIGIVSNSSASPNLAYPNSGGHVYREFGEQSTEGGQSSQREFVAGSDVVYSNSEGLQGYNEWKPSTEQTKTFRTDIMSASIGERCGWWAVEPCVGRVADGVPAWVDRIKCLGNAVVPGVAETIAEAIKEYEKGVDEE